MIKRKQFLLFLILLSFLIMGNSQAEKGGLKLLYFPSNAPIKNTMQLTSELELNHIVVLPKGSFDERTKQGQSSLGLIRYQLLY